MDNMEESRYSDQLIAEIIDNMDTSLQQFYLEQRKKNNKYFMGSYEKVIADIVHSSFGGKSRPDEISEIYVKKRDYQAKKKKRWAESVIADAKLEYDNKRYPYKELVRFKIHATLQEWKDVYGDKDFEDVVQDNIKEVQEWSSGKKTRMIEFPVLEKMTAKSIYSAFESDVFFAAHVVICKIVESGKEESLRPYVIEMGEAPYFSNNSRKKYSATEPNAIIPMSEDGMSRVVAVINQEFLKNTDYYKLLDAKDLDMVSLFIETASANPVPGDAFLIDVSTLAKIISGSSKPSSYYYDEAKERCYRMVNVTFNKYEGDVQVGAVTFLDTAELVNIDGKEYMKIVVGSTLSRGMLENKISQLPAPTYDKLKNGTAKILYLHLQKRRILLFQRLVERCAGIERGEVYNDIVELKTTFTYNDFLSMINFGTSRKAANFNVICTALQEYVDNEEIVMKFDANRSTYTVDVYFYPLSEEEQKNARKYNLSGNSTVSQITG